jgi:hypothetical protein
VHVSHLMKQLKTTITCAKIFVLEAMTKVSIPQTTINATAKAGYHCTRNHNTQVKAELQTKFNQPP